MATKYYHLTCCDDSIGVIKVDDNNIDIETIKEAIENHHEDRVTDITLEFFNSAESFEVRFTMEDYDGRVHAQSTTLLF